MPCILPDPLHVVDLGGHFSLPRDIVVSFSDSTAAAEAKILTDHLCSRLRFAARAVDTQVEHRCVGADCMIVALAVNVLLMPDAG